MDGRAATDGSQFDRWKNYIYPAIVADGRTEIWVDLADIPNAIND